MRTYGQLSFGQGSWTLSGEPQLIIRAKRIFDRAFKGRVGAIALSDTAENARELEWLMNRYPLEMAEPDRLHLLDRARDYDRRLETVARILAEGYEPPAFELAEPLRHYQRVGADLLLESRSLLLADDVGSGKTMTSFGALTDGRTLPALVVTLTHLPIQWQRQLARFAPALRSYIVKTARPYGFNAKRKEREPLDLAKSIEAGAPFPDVVLMSYSKLAGWADYLKGRFRYVIFDECQELRRPRSRRYAAARGVAADADFRIGLSATPIYNYGAEMFHVLDVLSPGELGTFEEFTREWCGAPGGERVLDPAAFGMYLRERGLMLRRTVKELRLEVPEAEPIPHYVEADLEAIEQVQDRAAELARIILAQGAHGFDKLQATQEFDWRLRMATGIAKAPYVADFVRLLHESGEQKIVLYGWHREVYGIWLERLKDLRPVLYTGSESSVQKDRARQAFVDGDADVLIISLRAGAGLDGLQFASRTLVFGELDWSPGVHEQCIGRLKRDGQTRPVLPYYLLSDHGSDPVLAETLGVKGQQIRGIRDPNTPLVEALSQTGADVRKLAEEFLRQRGLDHRADEAAATAIANQLTLDVA